MPLPAHLARAHVGPDALAVLARAVVVLADGLLGKGEEEEERGAVGWPGRRLHS